MFFAPATAHDRAAPRARAAELGETFSPLPAVLAVLVDVDHTNAQPRSRGFVAGPVYNFRRIEACDGEPPRRVRRATWQQIPPVRLEMRGAAVIRTGESVVRLKRSLAVRYAHQAHLMCSLYTRRRSHDVAVTIKIKGPSFPVLAPR